MARSILAQVVLPSVTGLTENDVTNSFAINAADDFSAIDMAEITLQIAKFYNEAPGISGGVDPLSRYLSTDISRAANACKIKLYDIEGHEDGSPHGSPMDYDVFTLGAAANATRLPQEVAVCVTIRSAVAPFLAVEAPDGPDADDRPDRPRSRATGRIYFGPINDNGWDSATGRPNAGLLTHLREAVVKLDQNLTGQGHRLAVWSRKDAALYNFGSAQTDNAFDTQRRRGLDPTARVTLALP